MPADQCTPCQPQILKEQKSLYVCGNVARLFSCTRNLFLKIRFVELGRKIGFEWFCLSPKESSRNGKETGDVHCYSGALFCSLPALCFQGMCDIPCVAVWAFGGGYGEVSGPFPSSWRVECRGLSRDLSFYPVIITSSLFSPLGLPAKYSTHTRRRESGGLCSRLLSPVHTHYLTFSFNRSEITPH